MFIMVLASGYERLHKSVRLEFNASVMPTSGQQVKMLQKLVLGKGLFFFVKDHLLHKKIL